MMHIYISIYIYILCFFFFPEGLFNVKTKFKTSLSQDECCPYLARNFPKIFEANYILISVREYPASRVDLQDSPSLTIPTFDISVSRLCSETDRQKSNIKEGGE